MMLVTIGDYKRTKESLWCGRRVRIPQKFGILQAKMLQSFKMATFSFNEEWLGRQYFVLHAITAAGWVMQFIKELGNILQSWHLRSTTAQFIGSGSGSTSIKCFWRKRGSGKKLFRGVKSSKSHQFLPLCTRTSWILRVSLKWGWGKQDIFFEKPPGHISFMTLSHPG